MSHQLLNISKVQAQSISTDATQLTFPSKSSVSAELTQKQNKPVGGHWTDFSNNYGGCTTDVKEGTFSKVSFRGFGNMDNGEHTCPPNPARIILVVLKND